MKLLTKVIENQLRKNAMNQDGGKDHKPVLKIFNPSGSQTWLFSELNDDGDTLWGLCDLGAGFPELGYASLKELSEVRGKLGLPLERDLWFTADKTLGEYADAARKAERIVS